MADSTPSSQVGHSNPLSFTPNDAMRSTADTDDYTLNQNMRSNIRITMLEGSFHPISSLECRSVLVKVLCDTIDEFSFLARKCKTFAL